MHKMHDDDSKLAKRRGQPYIVAQPTVLKGVPVDAEYFRTKIDIHAENQLVLSNLRWQNTRTPWIFGVSRPQTSVVLVSVA